VSKVAYQARFLNHAYLERERNTDLAIGLYEDGALVAPSGGEVSIFNASGVAVVNAAAVVVSVHPEPAPRPRDRRPGAVFVTAAEVPARAAAARRRRPRPRRRHHAHVRHEMLAVAFKL